MKLKPSILAAAAMSALLSGAADTPKRRDWQISKDKGHKALRAKRKLHRQNVKNGRA